MVICNFFVTKIILVSMRSMQRLNISLMENLKDQSKNERNSSHIQKMGSNSSTKTKLQFVSKEEIKFINMSNWLTAIFVITWGTQMVSGNSFN